MSKQVKSLVAAIAAVACGAALPTGDVHRGHIERPLDEARCGARPEEATLTALIQDADGRPIGGARLVVFESNAGAALLREFVEARGMDDGRACVRTAQNGAIVVGVFAPGYLPSTRRVECTVGTRIDLEPFVLDAGASIQGRCGSASGFARGID